MTDNSRAMAMAMVGAALGGIAAFMFFTPQGRALRRRLEPAIEDFARELDNFRGTFMKASSVASESWKVLHETLGEAGSATAASSARYSNPHQTSPF